MPLTSSVVRFHELMLVQSELACKQTSPTPSFAKGTVIAVAGLHTVAACALRTPITPVRMTTKIVIASEKIFTFLFLKSVLKDRLIDFFSFGFVAMGSIGHCINFTSAY